MAKRIPYKITDLESLQKAYPEIVSEETIVRRVVDKEKLYKIVKLSAELGRAVDGVEIGGTDEEWGKRAKKAGDDGYLSADETKEFIDKTLATETIPAFLKGKE